MLRPPIGGVPGLISTPLPKAFSSISDIFPVVAIMPCGVPAGINPLKGWLTWAGCRSSEPVLVGLCAVTGAEVSEARQSEAVL